MRVLIFGGRDFFPTNEAWRFLQDNIPWDTEDVVVISGGAAGADSLGEAFAAAHSTGLERYKADWKTHGKAAGFIRNQQMLESDIDLAIQLPGGNGTADMRERLNKAGVPVVEFKQGGSD